MDKIKKLSEAIRLGATFRPQCKFYTLDGEGKSCAFGAAIEAVFGDLSKNYNRIFDVINRFQIPNGISSEVIYRNNGVHGFKSQTREEISDWLESIGL